MLFESSGGVFDCLCVVSSRVGRLASFELVHGGAEFLHRERLHCMVLLLAVVLVFVLKSLRSSYNSANTFAISCLSYLLLPVLSCMCVFTVFLRLVLIEMSVFSSPRKLLKMFRFFCLLCFDRTYLFLIMLLVYFGCPSFFGVVLRFE